MAPKLTPGVYFIKSFDKGFYIGETTEGGDVEVAAMPSNVPPPQVSQSLPSAAVSEDYAIS